MNAWRWLCQLEIKVSALGAGYSEVGRPRGKYYGLQTHSLGINAAKYFIDMEYDMGIGWVRRNVVDRGLSKGSERLCELVIVLFHFATKDIRLTWVGTEYDYLDYIWLDRPVKAWAKFQYKFCSIRHGLSIYARWISTISCLIPLQWNYVIYAILFSRDASEYFIFLDQELSAYIIQWLQYWFVYLSYISIHKHFDQ